MQLNAAWTFETILREIYGWKIYAWKFDIHFLTTILERYFPWGDFSGINFCQWKSLNFELPSFSWPWLYGFKIAVGTGFTGLPEASFYLPSLVPSLIHSFPSNVLCAQGSCLYRPIPLVLCTHSCVLEEGRIETGYKWDRQSLGFLLMVFPY